MENIAIYYNKNRPYITVFTFDEATKNTVSNAINAASIQTKGEPREGNKPGSFKFAVFCSREEMNSAINAVSPS